MFKVPGSVPPRHGIMKFAGGQEVVHLKSDVLLKDLVEDQIQKRLDEERLQRKSTIDDGENADAHVTDLIPGVYEGRNHHRKKDAINREGRHHDCERRRQQQRHIKRHSNNNNNKNKLRDGGGGGGGGVGVAVKKRRQRRGAGPMSRSRNKHLNELRHPWFTKEMADLIRAREKAHKKWLSGGKNRAKGDANWEAFKAIRNQMSTLRHATRNEFLVAAMKVDGFSSVQPWPTKGIAC